MSSWQTAAKKTACTRVFCKLSSNASGDEHRPLAAVPEILVIVMGVFERRLQRAVTVWRMTTDHVV